MLRKGFTVTELLVVVAAIALVCGVLFPVLSSARTRSKHAVDISNLRQIVQAAHMYVEQGGSLLASPESLVASGIAPPSIFKSPLDGTREGLGNLALRRRLGDSVIPDFPVSYTALLDMVGTRLADQVLGTAGAGLYISQTISQPFDGSEPGMGADGPYLRALTDGAVVYRQVRWVSESGTRNRSTSSVWLFTDDPDKFPIARR